MKKTLMVLIISILIITNSKAQDNVALIGAYTGYRPGISYLSPLDAQKKLEIIATFEHAGLGITLNKLYFKKMNTPDPNFQYFVGFGGFIRNSWDKKSYFDYGSDYWNNSHIGVGINAIAGIDYKFTDIPIHLGASLRPALEIGYGDYSHYAGTAYIHVYIPISELKF